MSHGDYADRWETLFNDILPHMSGVQATPGLVMRKTMFIKTFSNEDIAHLNEKGDTNGLVTYTGNNNVSFSSIAILIKKHHDRKLL